MFIYVPVELSPKLLVTLRYERAHAFKSGRRLLSVLIVEHALRSRPNKEQNLTNHVLRELAVAGIMILETQKLRNERRKGAMS